MYNWESVKEVIYEHYVVRGWTLPQVMEYLERNGFWRSPGQERSPCMRSYRQKLAQWQYLRREDEGKGSMKGKGSGAAANSQTGSSKTQISHPPATNGVPLQVGGSDQAATAQSGFNFDAGQDMGQFDQFGGGDGQFGQLQYDNMQDCQDPDCQEEHGNECTCPPNSEIMCPACVMRNSNIGQ